MGGHFRVCLGHIGEAEHPAAAPHTSNSLLQMCQGLKDRTSSEHFGACPRVQDDGGEEAGAVHSASLAPAVSVTTFVISHTGCSLLPHEKKNQGTKG